MTNNKHTTHSRRDFSSYLSSKDDKERNAFERESINDPFENDALEGWTESGATIRSMKNLDKKFRIKSNFTFWFVTSIVIIAISSGIFIYNSKDQKETQQLADNSIKEEIAIEKTDIVIPEKIEAMVELPKKEQIKVKTVIQDFIENKNESAAPDPVEINELTTHKTEMPAEIEKTISKKHFSGKEIYLHDLKLLDYREYRSKPTIETKQLILSGTPANLDSKESVEEEPEWRTVDIPYMEYLSKTMELFSKGNNKKSLARFQVILETYSDDINANFYAGLCYYNLKEYSSAITSFQKCMNSSYNNFSEEAEWYLAKSLLANGKKSEASEIFNQIIQHNGYYALQAKKIVSSL